MPGPAPKNPAVRQRRNARATRATLPAETQPIASAPRLPKNPNGEWETLTRKWWRDVWSSPMRDEFLRADLGALFRLAILVDMFWKSGSLDIAKEIRMIEKEFGLTPMSRRRLEWTVEDVQEKKERGELRRSKRAILVGGDDPRGAL